MSKLTRISKVKTVDDGLAKGVHFYVKAAEALVAGNAVYASGAVGNSGAIEVSKYIANNTIDERRFLGICQQDLAINEFGYVLSTGILKGVDTTGAGFDTAIGETWLEGDILFASPTYAGELTKVQPSAPNQVIPCAFILKKNANGTIAIRAYDLGYHLNELHDLEITTPTEGEVLRYNDVSDIWENTDSLVIDASGNVGIGTASPQKKLDIASGDIRLDNSKSIFFATTDANIGRVSITGDEASDFIRLKVDNNNSHVLHLNTTGVGIGTTSPTEKLEVNGNIKASGTLIAKQYQAFQCNFINDISTTKYYLPLETVAAQTVRYQDEACMLAHADGRLASVTLKVENLGGASGNITFGIEVLQSTGTGYSGTWTVVETETMAVASTHNHDVFHFHFSTAKHFDSTHMFAISIQSDNAALGGDGGNDERWFVTPVIEWDYNTYLGTNGTSTRYDTTP